MTGTSFSQCSNFMSVATAKYPEKKQLREAKGLFLLQFQLTLVTIGQSQQCQELEVPGHVTLTIKCTMKRMQACNQLHLSISPLSTVHNHLPKEWCHPQWAGSSNINKLRHSYRGWSRGQPNRDNPLLSIIEHLPSCQLNLIITLNLIEVATRNIFLHKNYFELHGSDTHL